MIELSCTVEQHGDTTLIELVVLNETPHSRRFRVANRLDGPVLPPRTRGMPAAGWDDGGYEGVVEGGRQLSLGYASTGEPVDPPAELAWHERETLRESDSSAGTAPRDGGAIAEPESVIQVLGDARPPRAIVGPPKPSGDRCPEIGSGGDEQQSNRPTERKRDERGTHGRRTSRQATFGAERSMPGSVAAEFGDVEARVEARIERGETLATATSVTAAARAIQEEGGLRAVAQLVEKLQEDANALRRVESRARALAVEADEASQRVPLAAFKRLA